MTDWPFKRCTGAHCLLRDNCIHHALPTTETNGLIWPTVTGEQCQWFEPKGSHWGYGRETDE